MKLIKSETEGILMKLSQRELQVLTLIAYGFTDKEVASKLKISTRTVQSYIETIVFKLNARNRVNAVFVYMRLNPQWEA